MMRCKSASRLALFFFFVIAQLGLSATVNAGPPPASITTPSGTSAANYTISWSTSAAAEDYELEEQFNSGAWVKVATVYAPTTSVAFSNKLTGTYNYRVRSCDTLDPEVGRQCSATPRTGTAFNVVNIATPVLSASAGSYNNYLNVSISTSTAGASLQYSFDNVNWSAYSAAVAVNQSATLYARATLSGVFSNVASASYLLVAASPVIAPNGGNYTGSTSVTLTSATTSAVIYYTLDGTTPTTSSSVYSGTPIVISQNATVKAFAAKTGMTASAVTTSSAFTIAVAAPTCTPNGGAFTGSATFSFTGATSGSSIYYTLDGSTPTTASLLYNGSSVTLSQSATVKAIATKAGMANSAVSTCTAFTVKAATPTFSPNGGNFIGSTSVTLSSATSGAAIYYTSNGSTPTTASTLYSGPITISQNATLKAIAVKAGIVTSDVATSAAFVVAAAAPTCSPNGGTFTNSTAFSFTGATSGSTIYYTLDGSTPTTASLVYNGSSVALSQNATVKAMAVKAGLTNSAISTCTAFVVKAAAPTFSPNGGSVTGSTSVALSSTTSGASLYYTINGSTPTTSSTLYSGSAFTLSQSATVKAIAVKTGMTTSDVASSAAFTIASVGPSCTPNGGTFTGSTTFSFTGATSGSSIYYTLDGSTPTTSSLLYNGSSVALSQNATVKAVAVKSGMANSAVVSCSPFAIKASAPTFSPQAGTFVGSVTVTLQSSTAGAQLRYTLDGSTPTASSALYSAPFNLSQTNTIKVYAEKAGMTASDVQSATFAIAPSAWLNVGSCDPGTGRQTQVCVSGSACTLNEYRQVACTQAVIDCNP